jgi:hypothetical protein
MSSHSPRSVLTYCGSFIGSTAVLSLNTYLSIGAFYQRNFYRYTFPRFSHVLNPDLDFEALQDAYLNGYPEILVIDNFLTSEALEAFYEFCLRSTIFYVQKVSYLGSYSTDGFWNEMVAQINSELYAKMSRVLHGHGLHQVWAYKYDNGLDGIRYMKKNNHVIEEIVSGTR